MFYGSMFQCFNDLEYAHRDFQTSRHRDLKTSRLPYLWTSMPKSSNLKKIKAQATICQAAAHY